MYRQLRTALQNSTSNEQDKTPKASLISQEAIHHGTLARTSSRFQVFEKQLWKPSKNASQRSSLNQISPHKTISSDSFSTVPPIVHGSNWGCIERDLETIIVLVLLAFNFVPKRSQDSLTLPRSRIRNSATVTLTPGDGQQPSNWSHPHSRSA